MYSKEQVSQAMEATPTSWIYKYKIKNESGKEISFYDHMYLWDIYNDLSPQMVCLKAAQIGFSTLAILKTFWLAHNKKLDIIYSLPTTSDVYQFVGGKTNRFIGQNPILQEYTKDKDTIDQKQIGNSMVYYKGTFVERAALMTSADLYCSDEIDRSNAKVVEQYDSRLQHSDYKWRWYFSNPSVVGHGTSEYWELSDKMHWFVTCSHCGKANFMSWPDSFDLKKEIYVCKDCHGEIYADDIRRGQWRAKYDYAEWRGYWIPLWLYTKMTAKDIIKYHREKTEEYFMNFVCGLPYVGQGNNIPWDYILRNLTNEDVNDRDNVVIGCDSGIKKHYVIGNKDGLFYYGVTEEWADIEGLMRTFPKSRVVIDAMPDITGPRMLQEKYPGRVFLCHYAVDRKTQEIIRWGKDKEFGSVSVDRNRMIQVVVDEMGDCRLPFNGKKEDWEKFYTQLKSSYRLIETSASGFTSIRWDSDGNDHWLHALIYWRIGMDRYGMMGNAKIISNDDNTGVGAENSIYIDPVDNTRKSYIIHNEEKDLWHLS